MTFDISPYYSVTVCHGRKLGPRRFKARAQLIRRDAYFHASRSLNNIDADQAITSIAISE